MVPVSAYEKLIDLLDKNGAEYRSIDHEPEGRTDIISAIRGHPVSQAAKCIILLVKVGMKVTKFVLAVVPGDARVSLNAIKPMKNNFHIVGVFSPEATARQIWSVPGLSSYLANVG